MTTAGWVHALSDSVKPLQTQHDLSQTAPIVDDSVSSSLSIENATRDTAMIRATTRPGLTTTKSKADGTAVNPW